MPKDPHGLRSRRGSIADALDQIHTTASRSETLTTFDDFASPPPSAGGDGKGIDLVQGGLSGLYSRIKASVGGTKDGNDGQDDAYVSSFKARATSKISQTPKSPAGTAVSSPVVVSIPSSRLQSPLAATFPDPQIPPSRGSNTSSSVVSSKVPLNGPKSPFTTTKSIPALTTSLEPMRASWDNAIRSQSPGSSNSKSRGISALDGLKKDSFGAAGSSLIPGDSALYSANDNEPFRQPRGDLDIRDDESDTTEDDLVMIDGGGFSEDPDNFVFPASGPAIENSRLGLQQTSRREGGHKPSGPHSKGSAIEPPGEPPNSTEVLNAPHGDPSANLSPPSQRPTLLQISQSHLPGYRPSRASSSDGDLSSVNTIAAARRPTIHTVEEHPHASSRTASSSNLPNNTYSQMRRKILDKEFWMKDENAKDCFYCGDAFSTFRRKHHCRTCGQIFDAKCTSLVPGKLFGLSGNLRVCKPCEALVHGNDDDSSVYTEDADQNSLYEQDELSRFMDDSERSVMDTTESDHTKIGTPTISIPMSRKAGEKKRRSAVIELGAPPTLARPSSSRSLRSLSGRPRSSSHKRHHSRHQHMRHVRYDDRAPFHRYEMEESRSRSNLTAFHHDNIIDPDLAPFMSDEGSSEDEQVSIFTTLNTDSPSHASAESERSGLSGLLAAMRKGKSRADNKVVGGHARDPDNASVTSRPMNRHSRRRNLSVSSVAHTRPSPRRTKSNSLLKSFGVGLTGTSGYSPAPAPQNFPMPTGGSKMTRSASMHGGNAPAIELNQASLHHVRKLLKQMLQDASVPNSSSWEKALIPILLKCTDDVNPDVQHNDDIDIRHYIKLKKIPGGKPGDTSYISGVVFTKKIALKSMPRSISNPRIVIVTFPIEYARHQQHFMSLEPVIAQEREYLQNLVNRIAALQPHVLLVQRNVSGLALEFLEEANIAVAYNVKPTVLNAVSRCTQTRMISSVDKLATDPSHLGRCESFDVKTYVFNNRKKTYIYLSGCQSDLGCTIALRGADTGTLRKLKRITEFMCYVVYNLKLETYLMRDEFVLIPSTTSGGTLSPSKQAPNKPADHIQVGGESEGRSSLSSNGEAPGQVGHMTKNAESGPDSNSQNDVKASNSQEPSIDSTTSSVGDLQIPDDAPMPSFYGEMVEKHETKILSASPFVKFMLPYLLMQAREQERRLGYLKKLLDQHKTDEEKDSTGSLQKFELVQPEMVHNVVDQASKTVRDFLHAVHDAEYDKALHNYQTQKRQWEAYVSGNMNLFDPYNHQKIAVLYSVVNSVTSTPCVGPEIIALAFYHEHDYDDGFTPDCTLGQYVEDLCHSANTVCGVNGCDLKMHQHHRQYVHGEGQMSVIVQKHAPKIKGLHNIILMWSYCRICKQETQVIPMSENTWKYSFAKYLELTFWSTELHPRADVCPHDIHKDHVRYFGLNDIALRIQYDTVQLYEVIVPRPTVTWKVDSDLKLKNEQFSKIEDRLDRFMNSVRARLKSIHVETVAPEKIEACRVEVERLMKRANEENDWLRRKLQDKYMSSRYYEIIPLNRAIRAIQEKAIAWDDTFAEFEHQFFPSEKDIRRLAALQLKKLFLERDESTSSLASVDEGNEESIPNTNIPGLNEEGDTLALTQMPSHMSPEQARDMLTSVIEEDQSSSAKQEDGQKVVPQNRQTDDNLLNSCSPSQALPIQTPLDALEREDVRHLDLAVSSNFHDNSSSKGDQKTPVLSPKSSMTRDPNSPGPSPTTKPVPLDQSVSDAIDNMQRSTPSTQNFAGLLESKIPRLVDTIRRESVLKAPQLNRTQSQPSGIPQRNQHGSASSSSTTTSSTTSKGDSSKMSLTESARALERRMSERLGLGNFKPTKSTASMIPRSVPRKRNDSRVSTLAKHFEQLSREFEKERLRERRQRAERSRQARAYPLASSKPIVEVYRDVHEAVQEQNPSDEDLQATTPARTSTDTSTLEYSSITETTDPTTGSQSPAEERHPRDSSAKFIESEDHTASTSHPTSDIENDGSDIENDGSDIENTVLDDLGLPDSIESQILSPTDSSLDISLELPKHEKTSLMKMLTSFWSERSASGWAPLDYPFAQIEHVWEDSDIIVREDEPSSIIALALSSPDYLNKLQSFRSEQSSFEKGMGSLSDSEASIERNLLHQANTNIRYGFTNRGVKAQCKIFYAQSFDALRRKCGVADRFVESLSRCSKWDSKGGKSKSLFLKTLDDRFVLKSLSPIEVNAFFRFAPNYFAFTHQNLFKGLPSVIAKMFGLFQVQIKTPTGRDFDWFMLVMENLFYDREPNRRFDLKGSMRNRKIQSTGERDEVLLDENLVDIIYSETPIFVREHTKKLLKASVWNDTLFLSQQNVMDYSLMAGFDDRRREIVVGIIDCIRTYTWDKKLESWIKDRGKNKPTITSPKDYRNRFRIAMAKYILQAPNCWHQFQAQQIQAKQVRLEPRPHAEYVESDIDRNAGVAASAM